MNITLTNDAKVRVITEGQMVGPGVRIILEGQILGPKYRIYCDKINSMSFIEL